MGWPPSWDSDASLSRPVGKIQQVGDQLHVLVRVTVNAGILGRATGHTYDKWISQCFERLTDSQSYDMSVKGDNSVRLRIDPKEMKAFWTIQPVGIVPWKQELQLFEYGDRHYTALKKEFGDP